MSVVLLHTKDQQLKIREPTPIITSGNVNNDEIQVEFDDTWDLSTDLYAVFLNNIDVTEYKMSLELIGGVYKCKIPPEAIAEPCYLKIGVYSERNGELIKTSSLKRIEVYQGASNKGIEPYTETLKNENALLKARIEELENAGNVPEWLEWVQSNLVTEAQPKNSIFCSNEEITVIPECFDFSNLENAKKLFNGCVNLTTILPVINFSKITDTRGLVDAFGDCLLLEHARFAEKSIKTNLEILSPKLTRETVLSIQNALCNAYEVTGGGLYLALASEIIDTVPEEFWDITGTLGWEVR